MSLQFIFTETSFYPDLGGEAAMPGEEKLRDTFIADRYKALFDLGFADGGHEESSSLSFLRMVSGRFLNALTSMPELELLREAAQVTLTDSTADELLAAVGHAVIIRRHRRLILVEGHISPGYHGNYPVGDVQRTANARQPRVVSVIAVIAL